MFPLMTSFVDIYRPTQDLNGRQVYTSASSVPSELETYVHANILTHPHKVLGQLLCTISSGVVVLNLDEILGPVCSVSIVMGVSNHNLDKIQFSADHR